MDLAYDHIAEQAYNPGDRATTPTPATTISNTNDTSTPKTSSPRQSLQAEFQETFKAFSNSQWGVKLGGFWGNVRKQGESLYEEAKKEAAEMASDMEALRLKGVKGFGFATEQKEGENASGTTDGDTELPSTSKDSEQNNTIQETETFLERFKAEAAKRLKDVQRAEDAADEALLRFGTNIRNFLRDAVSVTAPDDEEDASRRPGEVLFESRDPTSGKRVIHTSRFDAQLHVVHTTMTSFTQDPSGAGDQWDDFKKGFDIDKMTARIAQDLDKYRELRSSMEKLVPEKVEYKDFWTRYYFLRHVVETQEEKRKELLKASTHETEEVGWDEDSDEEEQEEQATSSTPQPRDNHDAAAAAAAAVPKVLVAQNTNDSSTTIHQTPLPAESSSLKPTTEGRRSHDEKSVADSDASYDLVSGANSRAPGSPKDDLGRSPTKVDEESDEEDWE
ncbi:uncharacterized protein Z520_05775 [Fonsecaea multimorphosa CBS 102226]|uniref:BSD domain-containing protein n=1 Tax=Fonsecaea multimorphosa CBS 102226 TaxID=1442371 RepID=A0A0D2K5P7_9EURO|nr:uncharacterized protein Z520_05775 [Fonsecaea multimorphosa CBS 102226]KIX98474.1 hypothetical protein Z520_05775 [Fonsecaea multimorphosa CBS 102226]OAL24670.1 hypothetical protein AYO22_05459 [Fonsecaea multimorphosa]